MAPLYKILIFTATVTFLVTNTSFSFAKLLSTEDRPITSFKAIEAGGVLQIMLIYGKEPRLSLEGNTEDLQNTLTEVRNGTLKISQKNNKNRKQQEVKVFITYTNLNELKISGVSSVKADAPIKAENLKLSLSGASKANLQIESETLNSNVSGACELTLIGSAQTHKVNTSGAVKYYALDLHAEVATIKASGASKIELTASNELDARSSGATNISYRGNPEKVNLKSSGAGLIKQVN